MLFVHEIHHVKGKREEEFEAVFRDEWTPTLAKGDDARLLWYLHHAHGSGPAYNVVTITAIRDGRSWEELALRMQKGDLSDMGRHLDDMRHDLASKILVPVVWSPMQEIDLGSLPSGGESHELTIYMEDTGWPQVPVEDYTAFWERGYYKPMKARGAGLLDIQAVFQVAFGTGRRKEAILMQKIADHDALLRLLTTEVPEEFRRPGSFMHDALDYRDRWESKLLRTSAWSPLY